MSEQTLRRKLFLARKATEAVEKRGRNEEHGYSFACFEDVLAEASKQLDKRDILILSEEVEEELLIGKRGVIAKAVISYEISDTKTGESIKLRWAGTGHDEPGGSALFKAQTGTEKYFLARLLRIPFGTDPEEDTGSKSTSEPESAEAEQIRSEQDAAAEEPDAPRHLRPLPESDIPEPDWDGLAREEVGADA